MMHLLRLGLDIIYNTFKCEPAQMRKDTPIAMVDLSKNDEGAAMLTLYANSRLPFGTVILQKSAMTDLAARWLTDQGYFVEKRSKT